jgi:hypothetical protein
MAACPQYGQVMMDVKTMLLVNQRPQSSLVSRFTAGAFSDHNAVF